MLEQRGKCIIEYYINKEKIHRQCSNNNSYKRNAIGCFVHDGMTDTHAGSQRNLSSHASDTGCQVCSLHEKKVM